MKKPEDLKLKIGSPAESMWTSVLKNAQNQLKQSEEMKLINQEVLILAKRKIKEEQRKHLNSSSTSSS